MTYIEPKNLSEIITYVDTTIRRVNEGEISIATGASNIVGATLANNSVDVRTLCEAYPALEDLAEYSADTEVYDDDIYVRPNQGLEKPVDGRWEDVQDAFRRLRASVGRMKYREYLSVQSQLERMYDFHPDFFDMLEVAEREALEKGFLYATEDDEYPGSLRDFFDSEIAQDAELQMAMLRAAQRIYTLSGSGSIISTMEDDTSFPSITD